MILDPRSMIHTVHVLHSTFIVDTSGFYGQYRRIWNKKTPKWNKNMQYAVSDIYMSKKKKYEVRHSDSF